MTKSYSMTIKTNKPILLRCLKPKCPRKLRIDRDELMPPGTVEVRQFCDWHTDSGDKEYPQEYYDARGRELDQDPEKWRPITRSKDCRLKGNHCTFSRKIAAKLPATCDYCGQKDVRVS